MDVFYQAGSEESNRLAEPPLDQIEPLLGGIAVNTPCHATTKRSIAR